MDKRRRILVALGSAALVFAALAGLALYQRAAEGAHRTTPMIFLPGFAERAKDAARIEIVSHGASFAVSRSGTDWVLPDRGNYPANFDEVRQTLITMAQLTTIAPKTSRPDWLHYLALDAPPAGSGTDITVKDDSGTVLAHFIFGNDGDLGGTQGQGVFVRRAGENQSWLAKAVFPLHGDIASWMKHDLFDLGPGRLQEVVVTPAGGPGYTVGRQFPSQDVSVLKPKVSNPDFHIIDDLGYAVAAFIATDVRPAAQIDFKGATEVAAHSFDGLALNFAVVQMGEDYWARIGAATAPGVPGNITQEAAAINARVQGWAFKLQQQKGKAMTASLAQLMTPPPPKTGTIAGPGMAPPPQ